MLTVEHSISGGSILGALAVFGIRTRFDETDSSVKRLEVHKQK